MTPVPRPHQPSIAKKIYYYKHVDGVGRALYPQEVGFWLWVWVYLPSPYP